MTESNKYEEKRKHISVHYITILQAKGRPSFTVGGGSGHPVIVKSVQANSASDRQGLSVGSEIHRINGIPLDGLQLSHVISLINSCSRLELLVSEPSSETYYEWWDIDGRPVSPPPASYLSKIEHPCFANRWVFINAAELELRHNPKPLGLVIRGGAEYGLGIFISRVDPGSLAYSSGLQVTDQILNVNGHDFRMISHSAAVEILRSLKKMQLLVRFIGKLPQPVPFHQNLISQKLNGSTMNLSMSSSLKSAMNKIMYKSRALLDSSSLYQLNVMLEKYLSGHDGVDKLMANLKKILCTDEEMYLYEEIRNIVRNRDIDRYDNYLLRSEINKLRQSISTLDLKRGNSSSGDTVKTSSTSANTAKSFVPVQKKISAYNHKESVKFSNSCGDLASISTVKKNSISELSGCIKSKYTQVFIQNFEEPRLILIEKCRPFLGIAIEGGKHSNFPLPRIVYIHPDGSAFVSSQLDVGYIILAVNGRYLEGMTHREAAQLIAQIYRDPEPNWIELLVSAPLNSCSI